MKNKLIPIFMLPVFISLNTIAQEASLSLRSGINFSMFKENVVENLIPNAERYKPIILPVASVSITLPVSTHISFQPELSFLQKGAKILPGEANPYRNNIKFSAIETPLLFKYSLSLSEKITAGFILGPGVGYFASGVSKHKETEDDREVTVIEHIDFKEDEIRRFDLSVNAGVNLAYKIGYGSMVFDLRYQHGLTDLLPEEDISIKIRGISFSAGYIIPLKSAKEDE